MHTIGKNVLTYLKRFLQVLPFFLLAVFRLFSISLLVRFFRSSTLTQSLAQANLRHSPERVHRFQCLSLYGHSAC